MKTKLLTCLLLVLLVVTSLACSLTSMPGFQKLETGSTQTFTLNEPLPNIDAVQDVTLSMAVGELTLSGGTEALVEGEVLYNVEDWKPTITNRDNSLTISQGRKNYTTDGFPGEDVVNHWNVKLGNIPMNLTLEAGAYDATLDLSGLPIQNLAIQDGASESEIRFDTLNPEEMQTLAYQTAASEITFLGLANANFTQMSFEGGAGKYTFDFSGDLQRDANVNIQVGLSDVKIIVPKGVNAQVFMDDGLGNVHINDTWLKKSNHYENNGDGHQLTIVVEMGTGNLRLTNK